MGSADLLEHVKYHAKPHGLRGTPRFASVSLWRQRQRSSSLYDDKKDNILSMSIFRSHWATRRCRPARALPRPARTPPAQPPARASGHPPDPRKHVPIASTSATAPDSTTAAMPPCAVRRRVGDLQLGYSYASDSRNLSYGISGGAVVHEDGLTLSQLLRPQHSGKAPGTSNVAVLNHGASKRTAGATR